MKKFVICGYKESGKTTLIKKIVENYKGPVVGFFTEKFPDHLTDDGLCPIYIYDINGAAILDDDHLIGLGGEGTHYTNTEAFDSVGVKLITTDDKSALIAIDEIGFLENEAMRFQEKVFEILKGDSPVVIIIKQRMQFDFLKKLRDFPGIEFLELSVDNRDEVCEYIIKELNK